jgi:hypothetical protein
MTTWLPLPFTGQAYVGAQWQVTFQFFQADGQTLQDITGKTFQAVVRTSTENVGTPLFSVASSGSTANGSIVITVLTSTVVVTFTPVATAMLSPADSYAVTFWMNPDLTDAVVFASGSLYATPVAASV